MSILCGRNAWKRRAASADSCVASEPEPNMNADGRGRRQRPRSHMDNHGRVPVGHMHSRSAVAISPMMGVVAVIVASARSSGMSVRDYNAARAFRLVMPLPVIVLRDGRHAKQEQQRGKVPGTHGILLDGFKHPG